MALDAQLIAGEGLLLGAFVVLAILAGIASARLFLDASRGRDATDAAARRDDATRGGAPRP